ncbi:MAG: hypothetical protein ACYTA5_06275 [Planctomycetota bacterium]
MMCQAVLRFTTLSSFVRLAISSLLSLALVGCAATTGSLRPMKAGEGITGPWWMQQTAMTRDGRLEFTSKPWWPKAQKLKIGEQFIVEAEGEAAGKMLVRREKYAGFRKEGQAIVLVIDDDGDGSLTNGGDLDSDCYVADYGSDGLVDRMVDYIDNDNDNDQDEMDIRYFVDGELRRSWMGMDLDDDNHIWYVTGYEYGANFFKSDPSGNALIYMNRFDPHNGEWLPISECPFAFWDTDNDGYSEVVCRVSAVPLAYDSSVDPDYANKLSRFEGQWNDEMRRMGIINIRYGFDVDNLSSKETPLHYDMGFNLVGAAPYKFKGMKHFNPKRRPPQVSTVVPHHSLREISERYEAKETGFSWFEQHDDTVKLGDQPQPELDFRWEGVFWIWERRFMENTGGPCQKWNMRREYRPKPTSRRELYYSEVDRRIHLVGAEEGWIQIGHFGGQGPIGETRMYDTDSNGYFDRWEVYLDGNPIPVRVTTVKDEKVRRLPFDYEKLSEFYTRQVLPVAMAANDKLTSFMAEIREFAVPEGLQKSMREGSPNHRRYAQDVVRELQYQDLRKHLTALAHRVIYDARKDDLKPLPADQRQTTPNTQTAWAMIRVLEKLDVSYGQGDYGSACSLLAELEQMKELFEK